MLCAASPPRLKSSALVFPRVLFYTLYAIFYSGVEQRQLAWLITMRSGVRIPPPQHFSSAQRGPVLVRGFGSANNVSLFFYEALE